MLQPTTVSFSQSVCPSSCFYAEHDGSKVLRVGNGVFTTFRKLLCAVTPAEVDAEVTRLGLTPLPLTKRQQARALFLTFPDAVRNKFQPVLEAVAALNTDNDVVKAVTAVTVTDEEAPYKVSLLAILDA